MKSRAWMLQYGITMLLAMLLGTVLANVPLFKDTAVGRVKAAEIVLFLAYGGTLVIGWVCGRALATTIPDEWRGLAPFRDLIVPVTTFLVLILGYPVATLVCGPLLGQGGKSVYNWMFVVAIVASGLWIIVNWFTKCASQVAAMSDSRHSRRNAA